MNTNELKQALKILTDNGDVPFVSGAPGLGKSECVKQFAAAQAKELGKEYYEGPEFYNVDNYGFIDLRLNSIDVIDLSGLPMIDKQNMETKFTRSPYIPADGHGILFMDELPQAKPANMAAVSQLILDKRVGPYSLGDNWKIITAGNRTKDRASANRLPTHVANRLTKLELDFQIEPFVDFMHANGVAEDAVAFAKHRPTLLESFKPNNEVNCTPRSYIVASRYLDLPEEIMYSLMSGTIGEGVTAEFIAFSKLYRHLPDISEFLKNPGTIKLAEESDIIFATIEKLSHHANAENISKLSKYINRLHETPERQVVFWKNAIAKTPTIISTNEAMKFISENKDVLV